MPASPPHANPCRPVGRDPRLWAFVVALGLVDVAGLAISPLGIVPSSLASAAFGCGTLAAIAWVHTRLRPRPPLADLAACGALLVAYTLAVAVLSYLLAGLGVPLLDERLVAFDRAWGFDWPLADAWLSARPALRAVLAVAYDSPTPQFVLLLVLLHARGATARVRELALGFMATGLVTILLSGPFPAAGAFAYFGVQADEPYVRHFLAVRDGTLVALDLGQVQGIVQFPSFHLALALVLGWAWRGLGWWTPPLVVVNVAMAAATPLLGGHHLADLVGGATVALPIMAALARRRLSLAARTA